MTPTFKARLWSTWKSPENPHLTLNTHKELIRSTRNDLIRLNRRNEAAERRLQNQSAPVDDRQVVDRSVVAENHRQVQKVQRANGDEARPRIRKQVAAAVNRPWIHLKIDAKLPMRQNKRGKRLRLTYEVNRTREAPVEIRLHSTKKALTDAHRSIREALLDLRQWIKLKKKNFKDNSASKLLDTLFF